MALFRIPPAELSRPRLRRATSASPALTVQVRDGERSASLRHPFAEVYALRWAPRTGRALLCGSTTTDPVSSQQEMGRGTRRLYAGDLDLQAWIEVGHEWYDDPVELADGVLAAATQNGVRFLSPDGTALRNQMTGRFSWGAPGLSASPQGSRLAYVRWRGDDQQLCVTTVDGSLIRQYPVSCFRYTWWDEDTLAYSLNSELMLLEVTTGQIRPAWKGLLQSPVDAALDAVLGPLRAVAPTCLLGEMTSWQDRLWVSVWVLDPGQEPAGLASVVVSLDRAGGARLEAEFEPAVAVQDLEVAPGGQLALRVARHQGLEVVECTEQILGAQPEWWVQGWRALPEGTRPALGIRAGGFD